MSTRVLSVRAGFQAVHGGQVAFVGGGGYEYGNAFGQLDHGRVADPVGGRDEHFVAGVHQGHEQIVKHLLAAVGHDGVVAGGDGSVEFGVVPGHGGAQFRDARHGGVAGESLVQGRFGRFADVLWGAEVGLAHGQGNDLAPLVAQLLGLGVHRQGRRWLDPGQTIGNSHVKTLFL